MSQIPILSGIYADVSPEFRTSYPRNLVPVPTETGISKGYLRPADGLTVFAAGPGVDRGGVNWNGVCYRVMGTSLVRVDADGTVTALGDVGGTGQVTFDYSFDRLGIASGGNLYYWTGTVLQQVTDPDLGLVLDVWFIDGYWMTTDGEHLVVTELGDPFSVNPLKYGSSELDPDPIMGGVTLRGEVAAPNRYTIEFFRNVGGEGYPFQLIDGAQIMRGAIGTQAFCLFTDTLAFLGSGRNESPAVYLAGSGTSNKISTREIDVILQGYTEDELASVVLEARVDKGHQHLWVRLPDQTLVFDAAATLALQVPVWFILATSVVGPGQYRAQNLVWAYNRWLCGDPLSNNCGVLVNNVSSHYGEVVGWEFGTLVLYTEGMGAIVHSLELVGLPGYAAFGADPVIWTSSSPDGSNWGLERPITAGKFGQTTKRLCWRLRDRIRNWRIQRFRGTSDTHMSIARLEAVFEPLGAIRG